MKFGEEWHTVTLGILKILPLSQEDNLSLQLRTGLFSLLPEPWVSIESWLHADGGSICVQHLFKNRGPHPSPWALHPCGSRSISGEALFILVILKLWLLRCHCWLPDPDPSGAPASVSFTVLRSCSASGSQRYLSCFLTLTIPIYSSIIVGFNEGLRVRHRECSKAWRHCVILTRSSSLNALVALSSKNDYGTFSHMNLKWNTKL